ncbi:MAG: hypothetical protein DWQ31_19635 [Planctomycetota bacterium]|nr:MAG: hypothetical protein DWQ31_19635 [Planctomycetota bacterium]REJ88752.1 MAG: hypothetical protein DWQ35_19305 [Planctomycetota bacterium]REK26593.1 MAG: hypothetical protein DWQ42_08700 [Planctomycetota bacterium]REK46094.1 MAG: hypothetical protein DWQ46_07225 [Planctomycetota bacterium]
MTQEEILALCTHNLMVTPFVRRYGRLYKPQPLPRPFRAGRIRACFANSYRMAVRHRLTYVEGYAATVNRHGHLHAWCVDEDGNVFDRTWRIGIGYFGIPFKISYVSKVIRERKRQGDEYYGLLDDWQQKHPLITTVGDQPELWLEAMTLD